VCAAVELQSKQYSAAFRYFYIQLEVKTDKSVELVGNFYFCLIIYRVVLGGCLLLFPLGKLLHRFEEALETGLNFGTKDNS
jgi:hypothetical protein